MKKIQPKQFHKIKTGTIIGLHHKEEKEPFVYGVKINDKQIKEITPIYFENKTILMNSTGTDRDVTGFELSRHKSLPDKLFKKRIR